MLTEDLVKGTAIDGEALDEGAVRAAAQKRLGLAEGKIDAAIDRRLGALIEATSDLDLPLTEKQILAWATAWNGGKAQYRTGPARIMTGGRLRFEGPPAERVADEMARFLDWFNARNRQEGLIRAAIAHLYVATILPFETGNDALARLVADRALAQAAGVEGRAFSLSRRLRQERLAYLQPG